MTRAMNETDLRQFMIEKVATFGGVAADSIDDRTTFESLGLDSADAVVLAMEIEQFSGQEMDVALFLRSATVGEAFLEITTLLKARGVLANGAAGA